MTRQWTRIASLLALTVTGLSLLPTDAWAGWRRCGCRNRGGYGGYYSSYNAGNACNNGFYGNGFAYGQNYGTYTNSGAFVYDQGTTNGQWFNGQPMNNQGGYVNGQWVSGPGSYVNGQWVPQNNTGIYGTVQSNQTFDSRTGVNASGNVNATTTHEAAKPTINATQDVGVDRAPQPQNALPQ